MMKTLDVVAHQCPLIDDVLGKIKTATGLLEDVQSSVDKEGLAEDAEEIGEALNWYLYDIEDIMEELRSNIIDLRQVGDDNHDAYERAIEERDEYANAVYNADLRIEELERRLFDAEKELDDAKNSSEPWSYAGQGLRGILTG